MSPANQVAFCSVRTKKIGKWKTGFKPSRAKPRNVVCYVSQDFGFANAIVRAELESNELPVTSGHNESISDINILARNDERGLTACEALKKDGYEPDFYQVDVTNENTVEGLKNYIKSQYGGLDVLINNAGIYCVRILSCCERFIRLFQTSDFRAISFVKPGKYTYLV